MKRLLMLCAGLALVAACSKSDTPADDKKVSPLIDLVNKTAAADSASSLAPVLEARGFRIVTVQKLPAQLSGRRATAAIYRSGDGATGGVVYTQRMSNDGEGITWHWYFSDGAPDSINLAEFNGDGLWDVRVFMAGGTTRDFTQGEAFSFMTDRVSRFAMNGASSGSDLWKAFDGDTATAWQSPSKDAYIELPLPLGVGEGKMRLRVASGSRTAKMAIFSGDKKVQDVALERSRDYQEVTLDPSLQNAPAIRVVVEGPAATVSISELEIR